MKRNGHGDIGDVFWLTTFICRKKEKHTTFLFFPHTISKLKNVTKITNQGLMPRFRGFRTLAPALVAVNKGILAPRFSDSEIFGNFNR